MARGSLHALELAFFPLWDARSVRRLFTLSVTHGLLKMAARFGEVLAGFFPPEDQTVAGGAPQLILHTMKGFQPSQGPFRRCRTWSGAVAFTNAERNFNR